IEDQRVKQLTATTTTEVEEAVITLDIKNSPSQQLYVLRTDEEKPELYISLDPKQIGEKVSANDWIGVVLDLPDFDSAGFYIKLKGDPEDKEKLQLFQGTVMGGLYKGPDQFTNEIESEFGFYPSADEIDAFKKGDITREEYEQVGERFANWVTDVSLYIK